MGDRTPCGVQNGGGHGRVMPSVPNVQVARCDLHVCLVVNIPHGIRACTSTSPTRAHHNSSPTPRADSGIILRSAAKTVAFYFHSLGFSFNMLVWPVMGASVSVLRSACLGKTPMCLGRAFFMFLVLLARTQLLQIQRWRQRHDAELSGLATVGSHQCILQEGRHATLRCLRLEGRYRRTMNR
jgi:hypothetical protein